MYELMIYFYKSRVEKRAIDKKMLEALIPSCTKF